MEDGIASLPLMAASRLHYDVFISFGDETRDGFTMSLQKALEKKGIRAFHRGDEPGHPFEVAVEDSAAFVVVISSDYAKSRRCLQELAKVHELAKLHELANLPELKRPIFPVFYKVDPPHVRKQGGPFEEAFRRHDADFEEADVKKWREALVYLGNVAGFASVKNLQEEHEVIGSIVQNALSKLRNTPLKVGEFIVGLDYRLEDLMTLLDTTFKGVKVIGVYGMGGIGKTTLTTALYNKLVAHFDSRSFISNVRDSAKSDMLNSLQSKLIKDLFKSQILPENVDDGLKSIRKMVHEKKVLIVLDDVDDVSQLNALAGKSKWFGDGTRIIITTRDKEVLQNYAVNNFYEVRELNNSHSLELFSHHALKGAKLTDPFSNLSKDIVSITGGLPLALQVFGSSLQDKRTEENWKEALAKLRKIRPKSLQDILKLSFDNLDEELQCTFLDIACLFVPMRMTTSNVIDVLKGCDIKAEEAIRVLAQKCLIKIHGDDNLWMHDQLRDMGRQIVQHDKLLDRGTQSRLWDRDEIQDVLKNHTGTKSVRGIVLDYKKNSSPNFAVLARHNLQATPTLSLLCRYIKEKMSCFLSAPKDEDFGDALDTESFRSMAELRLLQINYANMKGDYKILPPKLNWLQWKGCPLNSLPSGFTLEQLAVLDLSESGIKRVWSSKTNKVGKNLMVINLLGCYNLEAIPNLSKCRNLEKLVVERCHSLHKIHSSIGSVRTLVHLNLTDCKNLVEVPSNVCGLRSLKKLILSGCLRLKKLPEKIGDLRSLEDLLADETSIINLPVSIFRLDKLKTLSLSKCKLLKHVPENLGKLSSLKELDLSQSGLENLPDSIGSLKNLEKLILVWCISLNAIPNTIGNLDSLVVLSVYGSGIKELPGSIGSLVYLKNLSAGECKSLSSLPDSIGGLVSLVELQLDKTPIRELPTNIGCLKSLQKLDMRSCKYLKSLPESIENMGSLTSLYLNGSTIVELPSSIGRMINLVTLNISGCTLLHKLPDSIGDLKSLRFIYMEETAIIELPESFGRLSHLIVLKMFRKPLFRLANNDESVRHTRFMQLPVSFPSLCSLEELDARSFRISGRISDDFEQLKSLEMLNLGNNYFTSLPSSMVGLSALKKLLLYDCQELLSVPPLPPTLEELNLANCISLENICDLSNLKNLENLNCTNCEKVSDVPGLECMESIKRLYMSGCNACSSAIKRRLSKVYLKRLRNLSMPGSKIPDWFCRDSVTISSSDREIRGVIVGVVVSLDHQIPDDLRYNIPAVVDIKLRVLDVDFEKYGTTLHLFGVPRRQEDQVHLCRFPFNHPLIYFLKDGCKIEVYKRDPSYVQGIELKLGGIHLVYEDDDDYGCDEECLDESLQTVSQKLANFFSLFEENNNNF